MLGPEYGGLRPWELQDFTPTELDQVGEHHDALTRARGEQGG